MLFKTRSAEAMQPSFHSHPSKRAMGASHPGALGELTSCSHSSASGGGRWKTPLPRSLLPNAEPGLLDRARLERPRLHFNEAGTCFSTKASLSCLPLKTHGAGSPGPGRLLQGRGACEKAGQQGLDFLQERRDAVICPGKERNTSHGLNFI